MVYTVQMDLYIDDDEIYSDEEMKEVVEEGMESVSATAKNIRVVDISD